eukprot:TRINITY_DN8071_c0_g1_i1.p1 TRINITY_DN8071_c0_g1~~TRINITY_DN8071_c0_g1_i1.p1  ORF type:complete len:678 (-),score=99.73 TRINITY_DN8071_c0_g1_i1:85-2118(-)
MSHSTTKNESALETEVATITIQLGNYEKEFENFERETTELLKEWIRRPLPKGDREEREIEKRKAKIEDINKKEYEVQKNWLDKTKERDDLMRSLRTEYAALIKKGHQTKDKKPDMAGTLERSSVLAGTSFVGGDAMDVSAVFKQWELEVKPTNVPDKKRAKGRTIFHYEGVVSGKAAHIKEYVGFPKEHVDRLAKEYKAMKEIGNRNLLGVYGQAKNADPGSLVILLEPSTCPRPTLHQALFPKHKEDRLAFSFAKKVSMVKNIYEGLSWYLRKVNKPHGRIKLHNIILTEDFTCKLADYGLGVPEHYGSLEENVEHWFRTSLLQYMAPEVVGNPGAVSHRSDMFSLGMVIVALFNERKPFDDCKDAAAVVQKLKAHDLPALCVEIKSNPKLLEIVDTCRQSVPDSRSQRPFADPKRWDEIIGFASTKGNDVARKFWTEIVSLPESKDKTSTTWELLEGGLKREISDWDTLICPPKTGTDYRKCLRVLFTGEEGQALKEENVIIKKSYYDKVVASFPGDSLRDMILQMISVVKEDWFYGFCSREKSEAIINYAIHRKKIRFPYLVRLSERSEDPVVLVHVIADPKNTRELTVQHRSIASKEYASKGLPSFVHDFAQTFKLQPVPTHPERPFSSSLDQKFVLLENVFVSTSAARSKGAGGSFLVSTTGSKSSKVKMIN